MAMADLTKLTLPPSPPTKKNVKFSNFDTPPPPPPPKKKKKKKKRYLVWVILTSALTALYYLYIHNLHTIT